MKLLIVRHGDPDYSIDSLTEKGWREAEYLSERLVKIPAAAYYCSPLGRAKDTAKATLEKLGRTAEECPWLREFQGLIHRPDREEETICWDWLPQDWTSDERFFGRESWLEQEAMAAGTVAEQYRWVTTGLDEVLARHGYQREGNFYRAMAPHNDTIVFFCHFGVECVLLSHLLNISPMQLWHGTVALPTSVTTLTTEERRQGVAYFRMSSFGDLSHLYAHGETPAFAGRFCECFGNPDERTD
ncbi:histidine phosphatase family protein [Acutalibacter sp. 1XD8-33]|uniref:histidine phosphatase family protein n=1 Tax=Acutalibacter sp. 1XD8-33 TaxID=2320081 RepID=UPI000EA3589E|nr:histidine phosphatase family protein [Acutalibacter sp. 1XD8-33]RKJ40950.1 histidine phosphatase family protein [Acutalibacter sp. 1XD8-33]